MAEVAWKFYIDWDNDGDFDEAIEDVSDYVQDARWRLGMRKAGDLMAAENTCHLTMRNDDKRFSPESTASPYAGSMVPWRGILIQSVCGGSTANHWRGYLESCQPIPGEHSKQRATITGTGSKKVLQGTEVFIALQEDVTADEVIQIIVDEVDSGLALSKETGKTSLSYVGDNWDDGIDAYKAIKSLVQAERGRFFLDRGGTLQFWNRHHLISSTDVDGTVSVWHGMAYAYGEDMVNRVGVTCRPRRITT